METERYAPPRHVSTVPGFVLVDQRRDWVRWVNLAQSATEVDALRNASSEVLYGADAWVARTAKAMGLPSALTPRGRPRKWKKP